MFHVVWLRLNVFNFSPIKWLPRSQKNGGGILVFLPIASADRSRAFSAIAEYPAVQNSHSVF